MVFRKDWFCDPELNTITRSTLDVKSKLVIPHGLTQVKKIFGDFKYSELSGGNVDIDDTWESDNLVVLRDVAGTGLKIQLHRLVANEFEEALAEACAASPKYKVKILGGHCARHMMHNPKSPLSLHSWGIAFDINWAKNLVVKMPASKSVLLKSCDLPFEFVEVFKKRGWNWGGDWKGVKDFMHFQWATGC